MPISAQARTTHLAQKTIARFLNAAEEVFGKHGYEGTTIRAIVKAARGNLGTLQHYWGSKRALFRDLFERRFRPLQRAHLRTLDELEARTPKGARPDVEEVLRTLIDTTFFVGADLSEYGPGMDTIAGRKRFHALYGRALMDPSPEVIAELTRIFDEPVRRFLALMRRALPELSDAELDWRMNCIIGAQVFSQIYLERVGGWYEGKADVEDAKAADWILHFLMNGISSAPYTESQKAPAKHLRLSKKAGVR
jgi:AcrR family transcriptional regulator